MAHRLVLWTDQVGLPAESDRREIRMSNRARSSRRLASLLTASSGTFVRIYYDRKSRRYRVVWEDGFDVPQMFNLALANRSEVADLDITTMLWDRKSRGKR